MSKEAIKREQFTDFKLMRECKFSRGEQALLARIADFSKGIYSTAKREHSLKWLAGVLNCSISTVKRDINSLVSKGIITKRYGVFKTLILKIIPLAEQALLRGFGMVKKAVSLIRKRRKLQRKQPDSSSVNHLDRSSMNYPIKKERLKEVNMNIEKNFSFKGDNRTLSDKKNEAIEKMIAMFPHLKERMSCQ